MIDKIKSIIKYALMVSVSLLALAIAGLIGAYLYALYWMVVNCPASGCFH